MADRRIPTWSEILDDLRVLALRSPGTLAAGQRITIITILSDATKFAKDAKLTREAYIEREVGQLASPSRDRLSAIHSMTFKAKWIQPPVVTQEMIDQSDENES